VKHRLEAITAPWLGFRAVLVRPELCEIFDCRARAIEQIFGGAAG
jgi:hypothetical protein